MSIIEIILLAVALSIDSLAVSFSGAVTMGSLNWRKVAEVSLILAIVQTGFFMGGYYAGDAVSSIIQEFGKYLGFSILLCLGIKMIRESHDKTEEESLDFSSLWRIVIAGVATSIDAVAVGASFGLTAVCSRDFYITAIITFIATVLFSVLGMCCGTYIGRKWNKASKLVAGIVLIIIGVRIML